MAPWRSSLSCCYCQPCISAGDTVERFLSFRGGLRVAGHPLHAMLVHFPLALWLLVFPLELSALAGWAPGWAFSFWVNALALAFAVPTVGAGWVDFAAIRDADASRTANRHLYVMLSAGAVFAAAALLRGGPRPPSGSPLLSLGLSLSGALLLTWGGWLGGKLVFHHGVGADSKDAPR